MLQSSQKYGSAIRDTRYWIRKTLLRIPDPQHWKKYNLIFIFISDKHYNALLWYYLCIPT
jgi:hypothetical protein